MMTSATRWWRNIKFSSSIVWVILVVFCMCLPSLVNAKPNQGQLHVEVNLGQGMNGSANVNITDEESCDPVDHGEGRGGMKCLGCRYSANPAPKNCDEKKVYECFKGEVCVIRLQRSDSGKGNIEKGCTSMHKNKEFNKWVHVRSSVMGDIQTQEMFCKDGDCCNKSDDPYDAAVSFKASLLITAIMIMLTKFSKSMFNH